MTSPSAPARPENTSRRWLSRLSRSGGVASSLAIALPLLGGGLLLAQSWLLAHALHHVIVDGADIASATGTVITFAAVLLVRISLGLAGELCANTASETIKERLRSALVDTIFARPPIWTAARSSGALSTVVVEHVEAMDGYLSRYLPAIAQAAVLPLAFAIFILPIDGMVALLFLITAPLIPVFMALAGWGAEAASKRQGDALSRLSGYFADRLRGLTTLKLFGREVAEIEGVGRASDELRTRTMKVMRIAFISSAVLEFFAALGVAGVALYVGLTFLNLVSLRGTALTLEAGLFCLLMAPEVYQPLRLLAAHYHDQAAAKAAVAQIAEQMGELPGTPRPEAASIRKIEMLGGPVTLRLDHVAVATPSRRSVVTGVNMVVGRGEHIAILGSSGAGKSTLLEAIAGLRPFEGRITINDVELSPIGQSALRDHIGVLGQRPTIFAGSIADNIRLGRSGACDTAVRIAADRARVSDFAETLPQGLATPLAENGVGLSGGEIHRVALARLYLRDPGLLLLDEPTAHLDPVTEALVLDGLMEFARGRSMIVVTHSLALAARMDRCFRIAQGGLVQAPRAAYRPLEQRGAA